MKKNFPILTLLFVFLCQIGFSTNWQPINTAEPSPVKVELLSSTIQQSTINFTLPGFNLESATTSRGVENLIDVENGFPLFEKGAPDLRRFSTSLIIPNTGNMEVKIVSSQFKDYENIEIAPSKGVINISDDASKVAYEYGAAYQNNTFYPGNLSELREAHIMRNVRGQVLDIYPFQYNPVTKTLRVYYNLVIQASVNRSIDGANCIYNSNDLGVTNSFNEMYKSNYINYDASTNAKQARALPTSANGRMLIICYDAFAAAMKPFVDWKIQKGIETELVNVSTVGKAADIKAYVQKYYKDHPDLTYLVLVGDHQQVPAALLTSASSDDKGAKYYSDNDYTKLDGTDNYPEIISGRISAATEVDVKMQVKKFLTYEAMPSKLDAKLFGTGLVASLKVGPDNSTPVYKDMVNAKATLMGIGKYSSVTELYQSGAGGSTMSPTATNITTELSKGAGFMSWISHGSETQLVSFSFSTANVAKLTNKTMWPFIWNCSCVTGSFAGTANCFAESLLRAKQGEDPTGAIACAMSTRNMPMGPSEKYGPNGVAILFDQTKTNKSYGNITFDNYIKTAITDYKMPIEFSCMVIFGDPSLELRTQAPMALTVTHDTQEPIGVSNLVVSSNTEGAYISLTVDGKIIGTGYITGGKVDIKFKDAISTDKTITVTATAFNYAPYIGSVSVGKVTAVDRIEYNNVFNAYPNPNSGTFIISFNNPEAINYQLDIRNALGQTILQEKISGQFSKEFNVSQYGKGIYFISLTDSKGSRAVKNIVVD
ncbi:MAG: C25 family cysteine peptidase [Bacteroidia bacterium]